ncbi:MAG: SpoIID/LytB domain-containing protein [Gemmiger sp.]|nr:SpoIID/LytB domain-containing protein [Gemmiger sp.]
MLQTQLRILRVFGLTSADVTGVLRTARAEGCPGLRLLERDGEFAVCVQASAPTQAMAESYCDKWAQKLSAKFGDALYATGEVSLAQATLDALLQKRRLLVAADEATGRLVGSLLQPLQHSEAVFDFGTQTYANPEAAKKIVTPAAVLKKFPGDVIQAAAGKAQLALAVGNADYAVAYMPATVGQAPFVLLCDKRSAIACAISPELSDAAIGNNILDLARRRTLGLRFSSDTAVFRPGHDTPMLIVSKAGQISPLTDTLRFSLRRGKAARAAKQAPPDFEPMLDFGGEPVSTLPGGSVAAAARAAAEQNWRGRATTRQPAPANPNTATPQPTMPRAGAARAAGSIVFEDEGVLPTQNPARRPAQNPEAPPAAAQPFGGEVSLDFDTGLTPGAAPGRTPAATPHTVPGVQEAVLGPEAEDAEGEAPPPAHSILDEEIPAFATPTPATGATPPRTPEDFQAAARQLFDKDSPEDVANPIKNRSLAIIQKSERRQQRTIAIALALFLLLVLGGAVGLFLYFRHDLGAKPASRSYGTAAFDEKVGSYLATAQQKQENVAGYLALPGAEGELLYTDAHPLAKGKTAFGGALAGDAPAAEADNAPQLVGNQLAATTPANTLIDCGGAALAGFTNQETLQKNAGFTLYTAGTTYRYKVLAVYYWDPEETGPGAFTGLSQTSYTTYADYMAFVLGMRARTLYDTGVDLPENSTFATLYSTSDEGKVRLCVTGRLITANEDAQLVSSAVSKQAAPLLTAAQYTAAGIEMPDVSELLAQGMAWYAGLTMAQPAAAPAAENTEADATSLNTGELTQEAAEMAANTQAVLDAADKLLAGLTDVSGSGSAVQADIKQGAEGSLPEKEVTVAQVAATPAPTPTPAPTEAPTDTAASQAPIVTEEKAELTPASSPEGETIDVTMNGNAQTLDLVQCLAMIAQNELGTNAPAEAYKAQCVAAHCWILSQGGYPSVAGVEPGEAALAAAAEVAHVLITYNGSVCFTPYFASASTGTASSADVWGSERAWLQAVDSPYDQTAASNWNTNGATTGCARFSRETLGQRISSELGIDLSGVDPNSWFKILSANSYGWVAQMQIGPDDGQNTTSSGRWFREKLLAGQSVDGRSLRSQCFTFTYDAGLDCFIFDVYGYGHGCGMSQWGAVGYANNGWDYQSILTHYYTGTTLTTY